ncbi:neprilysin-11-like [Myzus persicae]|uniref:neprilysin-11-like n=1 Tax=Myzus persicae TaxID=13164 RepID=UPI000B9392CD|nr:neprilysin-11-like [Myzus persicae]
MSDDKDLTTIKIQGVGIIDAESGYSKMFKNQMESRRTFYVVLALLIFIILVLIIAVFGLSFTYLKMTEDQRQICTTEDCLRSAIEFVESMNKSVDPCEDFYQFACGNFAKFHNITERAFSNDRFVAVHSSMLVLIRDFMERDDVDNEPSSVSKSRRLYRSCMATTDKTNTYIIGQLVQILDKIGLSFKVITNRQEASNLSSILAKLKKQINSDYLFTTNVIPDSKNRTVNRISLFKPIPTNKLSVLKITENIMAMNSKKMREILVSENEPFNTNDTEQNTDKNDYFKSYKKFFIGVLEEIYKLHSNDCKIYVPYLKNENISRLLSFSNEHSKILNEVHGEDDTRSSVFMTVDQLQMYTNNITQYFTKTDEQIIDWKEYLTILFMDVKNVTLDFETDLIQIYNIEYFKALFKLISKHKDQLIINIWWEAVCTLLPYTTTELRFIRYRFLQETKIHENNPPRSLYCAHAVNSMMEMAVSHLFLDIEPVYNNMEMAADMFKNIHWAFEKIVKELVWMDDTTKQRTLYKAQQMKKFIGFPKIVNDSVQLDEYYYDEFEVIENDYFSNVIRYNQRKLNQNLILLRKFNSNTITWWEPNLLNVNAFHNIKYNAIIIPGVMLQFPFFGHDLQMLNYGSLGNILGHELTHGFDNTGRQFDHDGNENLWWTNQTITEYEKRTKCFIHHYDSYLIPEFKKKISGKRTLDENIADNGGLREALWAYRKFVNDNGEEPKLPGLEQYTNEQIYYLAFANNWCEATTPDSLSKSILDVHSPNSIRVIAGLTNSDEFSEVWNCKKGSKMNPEKEKCKIW